MRITVGLLAACVCMAAGPHRTPVVVSANADRVEKLAAAELSTYLSRVYPDETFPVVASASGRAIRIGRRAGPPESFTITRAGDTATIAGADARGTLYGVYALLEKLGYGFYLSYDATPAPRKGRLSFEGWEMSDAPVVADRVMFNWHNFLSSASTWELADWQRYIDAAAKMRFNTIMVHAYGNNPMFTFRYNGIDKPVGYLATTRAGRDWGTQHVNDVRRLIGGEIFSGPVFGSSAAMVPEKERTAASRQLMQKVFAYARSRGMHVTFALDVDTESANPQDMIHTLPASARFRAGKYDLVNPDTPQGYDYYKSQVRQLLAMYPEIDRLAVWFRISPTPWQSIKVEEYPDGWKAELEAALAKHPSLRDRKDTAGMFAISKLVGVFGKALKDIGRGDVELSSGSWRFEFLAPADAFFPREASLMPLDWSTLIETPEGAAQLAAVKSGRKLLPVVWAHHDDRTYIGRPYKPFEKFPGLLRDRGASGFGIIHWTTRPLDLYFKSLGEQVWTATRDIALREMCERMAVRSFGEGTAGGEYLYRFITEAPMFGRETTNRFMDTPLKEPEQNMARIRARLELLSRMPASAGYFRDYERFLLAFFEAHTALERADSLIAKGSFDEAAHELKRANAEAAIKQYVAAAKHGRITRGEEAIVISLNLRWLPYVISARQSVGLEPIRIRFGETQHEPLAQGAGSNTFYVDEAGAMWKVLGDKETGRSLLSLKEPFEWKVAPMTGGRVRPGLYRPTVTVEPPVAGKTVIVGKEEKQ